MTTSIFRQTVAEVAARAKERLPEAVNGRIESAVKLVLGHDVVRLDDGSIEVGSSSDPLKSYRLEGTTCTCQDFVYGKGIEGWCAHRIAAGIDKRVRELLPVEPVEPELLEPWADNDPEEGAVEVPCAPTPPAPAVPLPEAPASVNCHIQIAGRQVQLTLRDSDEGRLLQRLQTVLAQYPLPEPARQPASQGEGWCAVHQVQMTQTTKDGRSWWSHKTAQGWCKGRSWPTGAAAGSAADRGRRG